MEAVIESRVRFPGLIAATHTPFREDLSLNLSVVERQAEHLLSLGVSTVYIGGSTGECHSLTVAEREQLTDRWIQVVRGSPLRVIVHVGSNCLADAQTLAAQAERRDAEAFAAMAPSYFKPANAEQLVDWCARLGRSATGLPFYFYDIPSMTGVNVSMPAFLERAAETIPNLAGLKFTNFDLMSFQLCRLAAGGRYEVLWGYDEALLAALALGATGAVGSTYNVAAPIYHRLIESFQAGDLDAARREQTRSVRLVEILERRGFLPSTRAMMERLGVPIGPPRPPLRPLERDEREALGGDLERSGLWEAIRDVDSKDA